MKKVIVIILLSISVIRPVLARQAKADYPAPQAKVRCVVLRICEGWGNQLAAV